MMKSDRTTDWHDQLRKKVLCDEEARQEYEAFTLQLTLAEQLKCARKKAHMTQEVVAEKMATKNL